VTAIAAIGRVTLRGLLGRRRALLVGLLAILPVLIALLIRLAGGRSDIVEILDTLVVRTILPLVALIVGTAAIGSEIEDGTLVFTLVKPVARWRIALAKTLVASGLTIVLLIPPILLSAVLMAGFAGTTLATAAGFALAAAVGAAAYAGAFTTLGAITSRALIVGLAYTLLWEGVLAGLLEGTRFLSIRQATLGLAALITGEDVGVDPLAPAVSVAILGVVIVGAFLLAGRALTRFQVRAAD
jgi:ABC-2 type transport system permease protein